MSDSDSDPFEVSGLAGDSAFEDSVISLSATQVQPVAPPKPDISRKYFRIFFFFFVSFFFTFSSRTARQSYVLWMHLVLLIVLFVEKTTLLTIDFGKQSRKKKEKKLNIWTAVDVAQRQTLEDLLLTFQW
jgi:hypothetical protein